jgi:hypothetical protein
MSTAFTETQDTKLELLAVEIESAVQITIDSIFRVGHALNEVRTEFGKNDKAFGQWRQQRLPWLSRANALRFMQVDRRLRDKLLHHGDAVDIRQKALYILAAPSTPDKVVEKAIDVANSGNTVTAADVKQWKDETQKLKKQHRQNQESLKTKVATLQLDLKNRSDRNADLTRELQEFHERKDNTGEQISHENLEEWKCRATTAEEKERQTAEALEETHQKCNSLRNHVQELENRSEVVVEVESPSSLEHVPVLPIDTLFALLSEFEFAMQPDNAILSIHDLIPVHKRLLKTIAIVKEAIGNADHSPPEDSAYRQNKTLKNLQH